MYLFGQEYKDIDKTSEKFIHHLLYHDGVMLRWKNPIRKSCRNKSAMNKNGMVFIDDKGWTAQNIIKLHFREHYRPLDRFENVSNRSGQLTGVKPTKYGSYEAAIGYTRGNTKHLGTFSTAKEAHEAYIKAYKEKHEL